MKTLLLPPELTLSKEHWQLTLSPSAGGRITSLTSTHGGKAIDWIMPMPEECRQNGFPATAWPKAGIYPLLPFSNRIRNGKFFSERQEICLPLHPGEAHAMHGFGHTAEWQLLRCDGNSAEMLYDHKPGDNGWPWAFLAKQTVTLGTGALILTIEISNISNDVLPPMPLGVGFHPYFPRRFAKQIAFSAQQLWQIDAEHLAIGVGNTPAIHDYRSARPIAPDEELTLYYGGWNKLATMSDGNGYEIVMSASHVLSHLVLHAPAARDYFCIEPVTHVADAINLTQAGFTDTGLQHLSSGHTFNCDIRLDFLSSDFFN